MTESIVSVSIPIVFYSLPFLLGYAAWHLWLRYIRSEYINNTKWILLEIKLPREITKTPQAMELALNALHQGWDGDNEFKKFFQGQVRTWFSLELVSLAGEIHFYIWTSEFFQNIIEAQFYAQYPGIEIKEVEDYVHNVPYGLPGSEWKLWGAEFTLSKEDALPIKTYVNYGLDKPVADQDAEQAKTDPITAALEYLGTIGPGEQMWIQILVQASKDRYHKAGSWFGKKEGWKDQGKALIEKRMQRDKAKTDDGFGGLTVLSPGERQVVEDVERSLSKPGFDCGIRGIYLSSGKLDPRRFVGLLGTFKQYNSASSNGFKPAWTTGAKYWWNDPFGTKVPKLKALIFDSYRRRSYFYAPYAAKPFVLSAEELATIYHFPGRVAATPSLGKIESKRGEPPVNLPI